jgi:hypothetical protein
MIPKNLKFREIVNDNPRPADFDADTAEIADDNDRTVIANNIISREDPTNEHQAVLVDAVKAVERVDVVGNNSGIESQHLREDLATRAALHQHVSTNEIRY